MSDLLGIGSSGISAYQRALATVSNNVANVSTEGYTRQDVAIASNQPRLTGGNYIGTGARFDAVRRQYDAFIESNVRNSHSELTSQEPLLAYVNRLIDVMGDESIGLTTAMNLFFESARDLATDPASTVQRSIFLRDADGLAARFRQLSSQVNLLDTETYQAVETDIGQVNSLTFQLAQLNKQLSKHSSESDQPSELLDQRDLLLRQMSALMSIKTKFSPNGSVLVSVGDVLDQGILVEADRARAITVRASSVDANKLEFIIDAYGQPEGLPGMASGRIGGVIRFREQVLAPSMGSLDQLARVVAQEVNAVHRDGVDAESQLGGDLFGFSEGGVGRASHMVLLIQDTNRVAAAGQFRVLDDPLNGGTAQARIDYAPASYRGYTGLRGDLQSGQAPQLGDTTVVLSDSQGFASLGVVGAGATDVVVTLQAPLPGQSLQVLTRDGRHILGAAALTSDQQSWLIKEANGMEAGATYDSSRLNALSPATSYLGGDFFIGAMAKVGLEQQFDKEGKALAPVKTPARLMADVFTDSAGGLAADTFRVNGVSIPAVPAVGGMLTLASVVAAFNGVSSTTGVTASASDERLVLSRGGSDTSNDIRVSMGTSGTPYELSRLGLGTSVYINGSAPDDLVMFVTGPNGSPAALTAQFASGPTDIRQTLRASPLVVEFLSDTEYSITDQTTGTVVAERTLAVTPDAPTPRITYRGLVLEFSTYPKAGDKFTIDNNKDGIGNNEAMLKLVALENERLMPGGLTMTEAYIERVNQVGNVARQAAIAEQALTVVYEQALEARDGVSGVSLDQEAAELVRFQQAYQANAKVMQIASQLFDTILQVR